MIYHYEFGILNWHKKYTWASVYSLDMEVRRSHGNKSLNFTNYGWGLHIILIPQHTGQKRKKNASTARWISIKAPHAPFVMGLVPGADR